MQRKDVALTEKPEFPFLQKLQKIDQSGIELIAAPVFTVRKKQSERGSNFKFKPQREK